MSDKEEAVQQEVKMEEPAVIINVGIALADAREALNISIEDAAQQLRLSARQLHALEANDYSGLPGSTFIRGFIRNYARLLKIDPEPLLLALDVRSADVAPHAITLQSEDIAISQRDRRLWLPYAIGSVVVVILLGAWMLYMDYRESHPVAKKAAMVAQPASDKFAGGYSPEQIALPGADESTPPISPSVEVAPPDSTPSASVPAVVDKASATGASEASNTAPVSTAKTSRLKIAFSQESWVRVYDHDGKEIVHRTGTPGSESIADGVPPLKVEVGNAAGVRITYNDKPVDITPHTKANVARFSLE